MAQSQKHFITGLLTPEPSSLETFCYFPKTCTAPGAAWEVIQVWFCFKQAEPCMVTPNQVHWKLCRWLLKAPQKCSWGRLGWSQIQGSGVFLVYFGCRVGLARARCLVLVDSTDCLNLARVPLCAGTMAFWLLALSFSETCKKYTVMKSSEDKLPICGSRGWAALHK